MFANLIESGSHKGVYARSGKFFLGTLTIYALAFLAIGVGSIYAYNAHIDNDNLQLISLVTPVESSEVQPVRNRIQPRQAGSATNSSRGVVVKTPPSMVTMDTRVIPHGTSVTTPTTELPVGTIYKIGNSNLGDIFGSNGDRTGNSTGGDGSGGSSQMDVLVKETPPPPIKRETKPSGPAPTVSKGVINGLAIDLPKPAYPPIAKAAHASGMVTVQVLIDEKGKVISASAVKGNPLLYAESVQAAYRARFTPTLLSEQPVKVSGIITYNFVMQ